MIPSLPLGSLKREEVYSLLAGLYVAMAWTLFFARTGFSNSYREINVLTASAFLITWLTAVMLVYLLNSLIWLLISLFAKQRVLKRDVPGRRKILKLGDKPLYYFKIDYFDEFALQAHISSLIFIVVWLSAYPLLVLITPVVNLAYSRIFWFSIVLIQAYFLFVLYLYWRIAWAFNSLYELNMVILIDYRKFAEEAAKYMAAGKASELQTLLQSTATQADAQKK